MNRGLICPSSSYADATPQIKLLTSSPLVETGIADGIRHCTFYTYLPAQRVVAAPQEKAVPHEEMGSEAVEGKGETILVVEDEERVKEVLWLGSLSD
jgi:hypothetical protein